MEGFLHTGQIARQQTLNALIHAPPGLRTFFVKPAFPQAGGGELHGRGVGGVQTGGKHCLGGGEDQLAERWLLFGGTAVLKKPGQLVETGQLRAGSGGMNSSLNRNMETSTLPPGRPDFHARGGGRL